MSTLPLGRRRAGLRPRKSGRRPSFEPLEQKALLATFTVTSNADAGPGTLRQAVIDSNSSAGADTILFRLQADQLTIRLDSQLPLFNDPITIDGFSQPGYNGAPLVELDGQGGAGDGLRLTGGQSTVRGLKINNFNGDGISIFPFGNPNADNNLIQRNFIGVDFDAEGTPIDRGNGGHGISIVNSSNNIIGGNPNNGSNAIFHNGLDGVSVQGAPILFPTGNQSINNKITFNAISSNGGLGIDLGNDGVTPNNVDIVPNLNPNYFQNYPVIESATTFEFLDGSRQTEFEWSFNSRPNTSFELQFYDNPFVGSGEVFGQGEQYFFRREVTTDADGNASGREVLRGVALSDNFRQRTITAIATDAVGNVTLGNTSEFSRATRVNFISQLIDLGVTIQARDPLDPTRELQVVEAGQPVLLIVTVRNNNPINASLPAQVTLNLPESVSIQGDPIVSPQGSPPFTVSLDGTTVVANFGPLSGGGQGTLLLTVVPSLPGLLQTLARVTGGGINDFNADNDRATSLTQVVLNPSTSVLNFRVRDFSIGESGDFATIEVVRTNSAAGTVSVDYRTVDGTAVAGVNYVSTSGTLTFGNNEQIKTFTVPILNNETVDPNRTVFIQLLGASPTPGALIAVPRLATLTIFDDDTPNPAPQFLQFSESQFTAQENQGQVAITVRRTGGTAGEVSIPYSTASGTAIADVDFTPVSGVLRFVSGQEVASFTVPLIDNAVVDGNRAFSVSLGNGTGAAPGSPRTAQVTIIDDESPPLGFFGFSSAQFTAVENEGRATITVTRSGGLGPATVSYNTVPGTAQPGQRYQTASGTLEFGPGETEKTFTVELIDTPTFVGPQTVLLELAVGEGAALGPVGRATLTILDDEATPVSLFQFEASSLIVDESAGVARVTVTRFGGGFGTSSIGVSTRAGDAVPGVDYGPIDVRLTFAPGETSKTVDIPIRDNTVFDPDRAFGVFLEDAQGNAAVGTPNSLVVVIRNNDPDPIPPAVVDVQSLGFGGSITTVVVAFNKPVDPTTALAVSNYSAVAHGRDGILGTADDRAIPIAGIGRSDDGQRVSIALAVAVPAGEFVSIGINGQAGGLTDLSGNLLDGNGDGIAGGDFSTTLVRAGGRLSYRDFDGDLITYAVTGGGVVEVVRGAPGTGDIIRVLDAVPGRSVLRGQVVRGRGGDGIALIRRIEGIDPFGRVRSALRTPPFIDLSQIAPAAVDAIIAAQARRPRR